MPLSGRLAISTNLQHTSALDLATGSLALTYAKNLDFTSGVSANQVDRIFHDTRTLTASATEDLDLAGGLTDAFGTTLTFVRIKGIIVAAAAANTNTVQVGGAAANGFVNWVADVTDKINVRPGGVFALYAPDGTGYGVTAGTGDLLRIGNGGAGTSVTYDLVVVGCSA